MDRSDASALADLQMHWDEAYVIGLDGDIWSARYRTSTDELRAHDSTELRELIRADYAYRQKAGLAFRDQVPDSDDADEWDDLTDEDEDDDDHEDDGEDDEDEDEAATPARQPERVNFAAIRGERMST
jgi:hypothetical protein